MILGSRNKRWLNLVASDNQGRKHDLPAGPKPQESRTKPPPLPRRPTHGLPILTIVLKLYTVPLGWDSEPVSSYMKINDEDDDDGVKDSPRQYPERCVARFIIVAPFSYIHIVLIVPTPKILLHYYDILNLLIQQKPNHHSTLVGIATL